MRCDGRQQIGGRFGAGFAAVGEAFGFDAGGFALGGSGFFEQRQGARQSGSRRQAFEGHLLDAAADGKIGVLPAFLISLLAQRFGLAAQIGGERGASLLAQAADSSLDQPHFGGGLRDDGARRITTTASQSSCGGGSQSSRELYDPLGRLVRTEVDSGDSTVDIVERQYDEHGRLWRVSHPYRPGNALWTTYSYDAVDRLVEAAYPENSGTEQRSYSGNQTTIVEANGSQRRLTVDGLGRIQAASEFGAAQYDVAYGYDALDNLTAVTQGNRLPRTYGYDSPGRLVSASNPESGAPSYTYDDSGNPVTRTNGGKTICWGVWGSGACNAATPGHDGLNRPRQKSYSDWTPSAVYSYDACAHGYGRLCSVTAGTTTRSYSYDVAGRVAASEQNTDGRAYRFQCTWNLADGLESMQYPSGRVVGYCYDRVGRVDGDEFGRTIRSGCSRGGWSDAGRGTLLKLEYWYCPGEGDSCPTG